MTYKKLKAKHPDWNWAETEEIHKENLQAAADMFNRIMKERKNGKDNTSTD